MNGIIDTVGAKSGIVGSDVYPAGHVIKSGLLIAHFGGSHINVSSSTFQDTTIAGSIVTVASSANSRLEFDTMHGMRFVEAAAIGEDDITLRTSSSTTWAEADGLLDQCNSHRNSNRLDGQHHHEFTQYHYLAGTSNPGTLTSYTAGETLYWRCFMRQETGGGNLYYWYHGDTHLTISYKEIAK
jgi:hypothetical protein